MHVAASTSRTPRSRSCRSHLVQRDDAGARRPQWWLAATAHLGVGPVLWAQVQVRPDSGALPGGAQLQQIVNGVAAFSLVVLVGAVIGGAVLWAYGSASSSYNNISNGKRMVLMSALGAVIVGGAAALINFFTAMGGQI